MRFCILLILFLTSIEFASAQAIGVSPARLDFENAQRQLTIFNPSDEIVYFSIHPEKPWFEFKPSSQGLIHAGGNAKILVRPSSAAQTGEIMIYVKAYNNRTGVPVNLGIGIKTSVKADKPSKITGSFSLAGRKPDKLIGSLIIIAVVGPGLYLWSKFDKKTCPQL